jgi:hypothetical protein
MCFQALSQSEKEYVEFKLRSSLPYELSTALSKEGVFDQYAIYDELNPFYLTGDFNGDGNLDYAIAVKNIENQKVGILITKSNKEFDVLGAGNTFSTENLDNLDYLQA